MIKIFVDSGSSIKKEEREKYNVEVLPLKILLGDREYLDGEDLSMEEFLENLEQIRTELNVPREWLNRSINVGFSGGERKKIMFLPLVD